MLPNNIHRAWDTALLHAPGPSSVGPAAPEEETYCGDEWDADAKADAEPNVCFSAETAAGAVIIWHG